MVPTLAVLSKGASGRNPARGWEIGGASGEARAPSGAQQCRRKVYGTAASRVLTVTAQVSVTLPQSVADLRRETFAQGRMKWLFAGP